MQNQTFPSFDYSAKELSDYIFSIDLFIISLVSTKIISFTAPDPNAFRQWLRNNGIRDITNEAGSLITDHYFK